MRLPDSTLVLLAKVPQSSRATGSILGLTRDACKKVNDPLLPFAPLARGEQSRVVLGAMPLEIGAEVEQWSAEQAPLAEQQRDEQSPDAPIAVEERMDCLELVVQHGEPDERRGWIVGVEVPLQIGQRLVHLRNVRRNDRGLSKRAPRGADPVLCSTKFARRQDRATHALHENGMQIPQQAQTHRQCAAGVEPV